MKPSPSPRTNAREPALGDKILVFKPDKLDLVLSGTKKLEIRAQCYKAGRYFLGAHSTIYAEAQLGHGVRVESERHWLRLKPKHKVESQEMPYARTFAIPILSVKKIRRAYKHPQGAIGIVKYVPP